MGRQPPLGQRQRRAEPDLALGGQPVADAPHPALDPVAPDVDPLPHEVAVAGGDLVGGPAVGRGGDLDRGRLAAGRPDADVGPVPVGEHGDGQTGDRLEMRDGECHAYSASARRPVYER